MMRLLFAASIIAISLAPPQAVAQERAGDAALGAVSGALVFGPVGAAVGGVIGYTAGPSIARSWRLKRSPPARSGRSAKRSNSAAPKKAAVAQQRTTQGASAPAQSVLHESPAPRARPSAAGVDARNATPPMQAFE